MQGTLIPRNICDYSDFRVQSDEGRKGKGGVGRKGGDKEAGTGKKKSDAQKRKRKEEKQEEKRAKLARLDFL